MSQENAGTNFHNSESAMIDDEDTGQLSMFWTQLYTIALLINLAMLGALARLGIQSLTTYSNAPIVFSSLWPNFTGCFIMGFLVEDCVILNYGGLTSVYQQEVVELQQIGDANRELMLSGMADAKKSYQARRRISPLYIGLTTGFCGSFTSFSSFIRDAFLAMVNLLPNSYNHFGDDSLNLPRPRNAGNSLMAVFAVIVLTTTTCISTWLFGAHIAQILNQLKPRFSIKFNNWRICVLMIILALGSWMSITFWTIYLNIWRSKSTINPHESLFFSLVFAPFGCLLRFYICLLLNNKITNFPLGTFASNIFGTIVLGISYNLQRVPLGDVITCQMLKGVQDGFCGCLTTVSSWISDLFSLKERYAYFYCIVSILACLSTLVVINGSMLWTKGFAGPLCSQ